MPEDVKPELNSDSVRELSFKKNKSKIMVSLEIRSTAAQILHISEWAFIRNEKITASLGAVPPRGHISGESTGNGAVGHCYETYYESKRGDNRYQPGS